MLEQIKIIKGLSTNERKTTVELGLKLSEELGELSEAILTTEGAPGCGYKSNAKGITKDNVLEECVDIIIVTLCIIFKSGFSIPELIEMLKIKSKKWKEKSLDTLKD